MFDGEALGQQLVVVVRDFVARSQAPVLTRLEDLEKRIAAAVTLETFENAPDFDPAEVETVVRTAVSQAIAEIPLPTVDQETIRVLVEDAVKAAVAALPVPKDGRDADPETVRTLIAQAVAQLPPPKDGVDGRDVDADQVRDFVREAVNDAVATLPKPQDGKDADPEVIRAAVQEAVAALPPPKDGADGKSVDPAEVARLVEEKIGEKYPDWVDATKELTLSEVRLELDPLIDQTVAAHVKALPPAKDGVDGKDATPELIEPVARHVINEQWNLFEESTKSFITVAVAEQVATIPPPKDGKDGNDGKDATVDYEHLKGIIVEQIGDALPALVNKAVDAIPRPKDGADGKDATIDYEQVKTLIVGQVAEILPEFVTKAVEEHLPGLVSKAVDAIPRPKDGTDGKDADPVDYEKLKALVVDSVGETLPDLVNKAVDAIPAPKDGEPGKDAIVDYQVVNETIRSTVDGMIPEHLKKALLDFPVPKDGKDADPEAVRSIVTEEVVKAVAALPPPRDGKDGRDSNVPEVVEMLLPIVLENINKRMPTLDDLTGLFETQVSKWALEFEQRAQFSLQRVVDQMPIPKDGRDALDLDDLQVVHDGDGNVTFTFERGEVRKEFAIRLPRFKDRGIFKLGEVYRSGDGVTWAGSFWIAQKDEPEGKPGETASSDHWRMAVKRGRDGRDMKPGDPKRGDPVRLNN